MRRIYITFSGANYHATTERIVKDAPRFGADEVFVYDDLWLMRQPFYAEHRWLWEHRGPGNPNGGRGFGWFAWKPYIMAHALAHCADGDIVLYTDADTYPIHDLRAIYDECERIGTMLFAAQGCNHRHWCKRDCFIRMGLDCSPFTDDGLQHAVGRFFLFQRGAHDVNRFLAEWQEFCVDRYATTFDPSVLGPELPGFREHRTEQAIITNLAHKKGHKLYREACQFGEAVSDDRDLYPQLFVQQGTTGGNGLTGSAFTRIPQ